jgi:hypothetical protein
MSNFQPVRSITSRNDERDDTRKAHGWVFPPNPVTTGLLIGITDALAAELIEIIRSDCTDESGNMISEGSAPELIQFAARLEQNLAQKAVNKTMRRGRID